MRGIALASFFVGIIVVSTAGADMFNLDFPLLERAALAGFLSLCAWFVGK